MKKKIILLVIVFFIFWLSIFFIFKKENNTDKTIPKNNIQKTKNLNTFENLNIYSLSFSWKTEYNNTDLEYFYNMIKNNEKYFKDKDELDYFYINRNYIFWDTYKYLNVEDLLKCLNWEKKYTDLQWDYSLICKWDNKYIDSIDTNYFYIKDTLSKYKNIKKWVKMDCSYFLENNYDWNSNYKFVPYFSCIMLSDWINVFEKEYFYYTQALKLNKCNQLKDIKLVNLCNENVKQNTKNTKK